MLQQLEHPTEADATVNDAFRPVSRFFDRITRPEQLLTALPQAMRVLTSPADTGAVVISLPQDIQSHAYDFPVELFEPRDWKIRRPLPDPEEIAQVAALIREASRPVLIAGGGIHYSDAYAALEGFAETVGVPVLETFAGKGAVTREAWWQVGGVGLEGNFASNSLVKQADLVISVGTRLTDFATGSQSVFENDTVRFASLNVVDADTRKQGAVGILADARLGLAALTEALDGHSSSASWRDTVTAAKADWAPIRAAALDPDVAFSRKEHPDAPVTDAVLTQGAAGRVAAGTCPQRGHHHRRGRFGPRRPAEGVGRHRQSALPSGVRVLLHGLRAARRDGGAPGRGRQRQPDHDVHR